MAINDVKKNIKKKEMVLDIVYLTKIVNTQIPLVPDTIKMAPKF